LKIQGLLFIAKFIKLWTEFCWKCHLWWIWSCSFCWISWL